jgi:hypothetical protein
MGSTIWLVSESTLEEGDSWDHSVMLDVLDQLDNLCVTLGFPTISSFIRLTDIGNLSWKSYRKRATWFDALAAIPTFTALRVHIDANSNAITVGPKKFSGDFHQLLLEELDDCLEKLTKFSEAQDPFHLCIVS